jgi:UDP-3-O-[3-hydroxymyristoyl] glucosamine N-acyltransferase
VCRSRQTPSGEVCDNIPHHGSRHCYLHDLGEPWPPPANEHPIHPGRYLVPDLFVPHACHHRRLSTVPVEEGYIPGTHIEGYRFRHLDGSPGGWVANSATVSAFVTLGPEVLVLGHARVDGGAVLRDQVIVADHAKVEGPVTLSGQVVVHGHSRIAHRARVHGNVEIFEHAKVFGDARIFDDARVFGRAHVFEDAHVFERAEVSGHVHVFGAAFVSGHVHLSGRLAVAS